jgi:hypothetical protein
VTLHIQPDKATISISTTPGNHLSRQRSRQIFLDFATHPAAAPKKTQGMISA